MVEKFNFYDIYGYLLPGLALLALLWMPFGILIGQWPKQELSSALLLLVLAYLAGHLVQTFAVALLPSKNTDAFGNRRHPSDLMLDKSDNKFTPEIKNRIADLAKTYLKVPLDSSEDLGQRLKKLSDQRGKVAHAKKELKEQRAKLEELKKSQQGKTKEEVAELENGVNEAISKSEETLKTEEAEKEKQDQEIASISKSRKDAFFQARSALLKQKGPWYWEQFEGLYALMRGTCCASVFSVFYLGAWALVWEAKTEHVGLFQNPIILLCSTVIAFLSLIGVLILSLSEPSPPRREPPTSKRWGLGFLLAIVFGLIGMLAAAKITVATSDRKACAAVFSVSTCPPEAETSSGTQKLALGADSYPVLFVLCVCLAAVAASRFYGAYKMFADSFAEHVWRDFANLEVKTSPAESKS